MLLVSIIRQRPPASHAAALIPVRLGPEASSSIGRHRQFFHESEAVARIAKLFVKLMRFFSLKARVHRHATNISLSEISFRGGHECVTDAAAAHLFRYHQRQNPRRGTVMFVS